MMMINEMGKRAKAASFELAKMPTEAKNMALMAMAVALEKNFEEIVEANQKDICLLYTSPSPRD